MTQHDMTVNNQGFPNFRADMNNALKALASSASGGTQPGTRYPNQLWADTSNNLLKIRKHREHGMGYSFSAERFGRR